VGETLSIVVPVFNEERRLPELLDAVLDEGGATVERAGLELVELIVVDDGSEDGTAALLAERSGTDPRLRVTTLARNRGKGAAVRAGVLGATGDLVLVTDVDLSTPLDDLERLAEGLGQDADLAIGSRAHPDSQVVVHQPAYRELMGKTFNVLFRLLTGLPWRDTQCGFKLFRLETTRRLFELQRVERFAYDAELCVNADRLGLSIVEVPVTWRNNLDTHVTLVGSSFRMAVDLGAVAWRRRRPLDAPPVAEPVASIAPADPS